MAIFTRALGWSKEEVEVFLVDVRKNIKDMKIHCYWEMHVPNPSNYSNPNVGADTTSLDKSHCKVSGHCERITGAVCICFGILELQLG